MCKFEIKTYIYKYDYYWTEIQIVDSTYGALESREFTNFFSYKG